MSLSDLASLGSFVSGAAVLGSLVFLYFQLRQIKQQFLQAERNQQAAIRQVRATQAVDILSSGVEPSVAEALARGQRGEEDISETTERQLYQYWRASFFSWDHAFQAHLEGLYTESAFNSFTIYARNVMRNIGVRTQWRLQRETFGPEFVAWMDKLVAETPIDEPVDAVVRWRDALAKERSGASY